MVVTLDTNLNNDDREYGRGKSVARGQNSKTLQITITNGSTRNSGKYVMHGRLDALLVEIPALNAVARTLNIEIYPADADADGSDTELRMVNINAALAQSKAHYVKVSEYTTANLPVHVFGEHKIAVVASGTTDNNAVVKIIPILSPGD